PGFTTKVLGSGAVPPVQMLLEVSLDAVVPGVMVIVHEPPLAPSALLVLHVVLMVTSFGRLGVKSTGIVGRAVSVMDAFDVLIRVIFLAVLAPLRLESASVDGLM